MVDEILDVARATAGAFGNSIAADLARLAPLAKDRRLTLSSFEVSVVGSSPDAEIIGLLSGMAEAGLSFALPVGGEVPIGDRPAGEVLRLVPAIAQAAASTEAAGCVDIEEPATALADIGVLDEEGATK
ncbi:MAG: hypothetical protein ACR2HR_03830 [Euzebya sp.]